MHIFSHTSGNQLFVALQSFMEIALKTELTDHVTTATAADLLELHIVVEEDKFQILLSFWILLGSQWW